MQSLVLLLQLVTCTAQELACVGGTCLCWCRYCCYSYLPALHMSLLVEVLLAFVIATTAATASYLHYT